MTGGKPRGGHLNSAAAFSIAAASSGASTSPSQTALLAILCLHAGYLDGASARHHGLGRAVASPSRTSLVSCPLLANAWQQAWRSMCGCAFSSMPAPAATRPIEAVSRTVRLSAQARGRFVHRPPSRPLNI
jgi:hypothetical protein